MPTSVVKEVATIPKLIEAGEGTHESSREGCKWLNKPVPLVSRRGDQKKLTADAVDIDGKYAGTFHAQEGYWYVPNDFVFEQKA